MTSRSRFQHLHGPTWALTSLLALMFASACSHDGVEDSESLGQVSQAATQTPAPVLVNQLGYVPGATKIAVVLGATATPAAGDKIEVLTSSGAVATGGTFDHTKIKLKAADSMSGDVVHHADFSGFTTAGTGYKVKVTIGGVAYTSESFNISNALYGQNKLAEAALRFFTWKRSGMAVAANTEFNIPGHAASHTGDATMPVYAGTSTSTLPTGPFDVLGGWYDAGDNGKYLESHTAATFFLAHTFERMKGKQDPAAVSIDTLSLGLTDGPLPDVLDEIAWGTRWVMGTLPRKNEHVTNPARRDLVMNKCTSNGWPAYPISYTADTTARSCMGPSTSATYSAVRNMAQVSRLLRPYGTASTIVNNWTATQYADQLYELAKEAFGRAAGKYPGGTLNGTTYPSGTYTGAGATGSARFTTDLNLATGVESPGFNNGSGGYADEDMADDEYAAAAELFLTACQRGDSAAVTMYKPLVTGHMYYKQAGWCDWGSESALGDPDGEEVGCGTLSLIAAHTGPDGVYGGADAACSGANALSSADIDAMKANHIAFANTLVGVIEGQNYPSYAATGLDLKWGSNGAQASAVALLAAAYEFSGDKKFLRAGSRAMDYLLGVNPMKVSYIIGFGPNAAQYSHDRAMGAASMWVKGTLVGGPLGINGGGWTGTDNLLDDLAARFPGGSPIADGATPKTGAPLKRYALTDNGSASWESKENAVNWNGSLAAAAWSMQVHGQNMGCSTAADCNDGSLCTTDACTNGACVNTPKDCSDGRVCSVDSCNPATGACSNDTSACCDSHADCSDGTACTTDTCGADELCTNEDRGVCCTGVVALTPVSATASSVEDNNTSLNAAKAIDGNASTRWASSFADDQWIYVDLGATTRVSRVTLTWENAASAIYDLDVATNAAGPWTTIYSTTAGNGGTDDITEAAGLVPTAGRYVRMFGHTRTTPYGHSLYEMKVYGDPNPNCYSTTITCGDDSCDGTENGSTCANDCGTGVPTGPVCGDGSCNGTETCSTCAGDCGACCTPATCASLGATCGTPSNGCGGTLSCGTCSAGQTCNASNQCVQCVTAADCNDNNVCTTDACNAGVCSYTNNTASCATDNNACTNDVCSNGVCTHPAVTNGTTCNDNDANTCNDVCTAGVCGGGSCGSSCSGFSGSGTISWDKWTNQSGTSIITSLLTTTPSSSGTFTSMEAPSAAGDNYQLRMRGTLTAPCTGTYTFWIAGDDNSELWLGSDSSPNTKAKIASVTGWTNGREWNKFTSQKSVAIALTGGQQYYIEAIVKEGTGGDNLAVGWAKPGEATTAPSQVIPGSALSPYSASCTPTTCAALGATCGNPSNGCGGTLSCGTCGSGQTCNASNQCVASCTPATCASLGATCGNPSNGCGGTLSCGTCGSGETCNGSNQCVASGGSEPCTPAVTFGEGVTNSGNFNTTGAYCFRTSMNIAGWGCSNFDGRTLQVNDTAKACGSMPLPVKYNGYYYFEATGGTHSYASIYWWP